LSELFGGKNILIDAKQSMLKIINNKLTGAFLLDEKGFYEIKTLINVLIAFASC